MVSFPPCLSNASNPACSAHAPLKTGCNILAFRHSVLLSCASCSPQQNNMYSKLQQPSSTNDENDEESAIMVVHGCSRLLETAQGCWKLQWRLFEVALQVARACCWVPRPMVRFLFIGRLAVSVSLIPIFVATWRASELPQEIGDLQQHAIHLVTTSLSIAMLPTMLVPHSMPMIGGQIPCVCLNPPQPRGHRIVWLEKGLHCLQWATPIYCFPLRVFCGHRYSVFC